QRIKHDHAGDEARRHASEHDGLERDVVNDVGPQPAIDANDRQHVADEAEWIDAAALPRQRFEPKALGSDALTEAVDPGRDGYVIAGIACRAGERKAMRPEVPILGHQEEEALFLVGARRGADNGHSGARSLRMFGNETRYRAGCNGMAIFVPVTV